MMKEECRVKGSDTRSRVLSYCCLLPSAFCILLVRLYQLTLSPAKTFLFGPDARCRFEPSCSDYALQALRLHGAPRGSWLAVKRVCRCHPWGGCGHDPVPRPEVGGGALAKASLASEFSR